MAKCLEWCKKNSDLFTTLEQDYSQVILKITNVFFLLLI